MRANKMNTFNIRTIPNQKKYILYIPIEYISSNDNTINNKHIINYYTEAKKSLSEYVSNNEIVLVIITDSLKKTDFPVIEPEIIYKVNKRFNPNYIYNSSDIVTSN